jgi:hypothetical protein
MTKNNLLKLVVFISYTLIISLQIQPTFAMENEKDSLLHCGLGSKLSAIAAVYDELHGVDLYLPMQQQSVPCISENQSDLDW